MRPFSVIQGTTGNPKKFSDLLRYNDKYDETVYICDVCGKKFYRKSSLTIHLNSHHLKSKREADGPEKKEEQNICNICNKNFTAKKNLLKHLRAVHKNFKEADQMKIKKLKCPEKDCKYKGRLMIELRDHIQRIHKIKIFRDVLEFHNQEEFQKWKKDEENDAVALFVTGRMKTSLINGCKKQTLHCHRTGQYSPKGYGKYRPRNIGSCKIGVTCPAAMETMETPSGHIRVIYYKTHLGHEHDVAHMKLTKEERAQLAEKIEQGFSLDAIIEDVKECNDMQATKTKRMEMLSKRDLYSVIRTVNNNIVKRLRRRDEENKNAGERPPEPEPQVQPQLQLQSEAQIQLHTELQPQLHPHLQPQLQTQIQISSSPPSETVLYQETPVIIGPVENQENLGQENFQQNYAFYPAQSVVVPQETVYLEPQQNFVTYQSVDSNAVPVPAVPVGIPQVTGEGVAPQVVIFPPEVNYGSVAEIVLFPPEQGAPPPPGVAVYPQPSVIQEPQVVASPPERIPVQTESVPVQTEPVPVPAEPPIPVEREPVPESPERIPVPREPMTLEETNKANRPNLRLQIQEKLDKIMSLLPDSEWLTPGQFSLISAKLNRVLDIYTQVSAKAKLKKQPMKKRILKKVQYDGNWRNNAGSDSGTTNGNVAYERETVLQQPMYEAPVLYTVYN